MNYKNEQSNEEKGLWGEFYAKLALNEKFGALGYRDETKGYANSFIFERIHIPTYKGKTTEVDVLYVSQRGVFVIEVKSWAGGVVFGEKKGDKWLIAYNNKKGGKMWSKQVGNPHQQNIYHTDWVRKHLQPFLPKGFYPLTLLVNATKYKCEPAEFRGDRWPGLFLDPERLANSITKIPPVLTVKEVRAIAAYLDKFKHGENANVQG